MKKTGLADSPLFSIPKSQERLPSLSTEKPVIKQKRATKKPVEDIDTSKQSGNRYTTTPRYHDTTVSRYHDTIVELVRKAVRLYGKEAATHRFTLEEKKAIASIIYTYKGHGIKTSENEIARIAVNFILHDYKENGENSILVKTLKALNK